MKDLVEVFARFWRPRRALLLLLTQRPHLKLSPSRENVANYFPLIDCRNYGCYI